MTGHKQTTDGVSYETAYAYNLSGGAMIEQTYPSGRKVKNILDNDGDLSIVQSAKCLDATPGTGAACTSQAGLWNYAQHFTYNPAGAVTSMQLGNFRWESTAFNSRLQPTQIALGATAGATNLLKLDYSYGDWNGSSIDETRNNGNIVQQVITVPTVGSYNGFVATQKYYYDSLNRIDDAAEEIASSQTWRQDFDYDRYGNRNFIEGNTTFDGFEKLCNGGTELCAELRKILNPSVNTSDNRLSSSDGYMFDSAGNTSRDPQLRKFTYDAENKQVKVETVDSSGTVTGTLGEYVYDGDGKRIKKIVPGSDEVTVFVYDAVGQLIAEYSTAVASSQDARAAYLTNDHLGSPRINTNENGEVTARHDYHPFGEEIATSQRTTHPEYAADTVRKQFTGYERDNEIGLDFAKNRFHNYSLGRFNSPDPYKIVSEIKFEEDEDKAKNKLDRYLVESQQWNGYVYAINNPLKYTDPTGEEIWLRGTRKDLQEAINLIYEILGHERNSHIVCNDAVKAENGEYIVKISVTKEQAEKIAKIGNNDDERTLSKGMAEMLSSSSVVEARVDGKFINLQGKLIDVRQVTSRVGAAMVPGVYSSTGHRQAVISPFSVEQANLAAAQERNLKESSDGKPLVFTKAMILAHELGEAWGRKGGALAFENAMRSRDKSTNRRRIGEH